MSIPVSVRRWFALALLGAILAGCQASTSGRAREDLHAFQREQSSELLLERGRAFAEIGDTTRAQEYLEAAIEAGGDETKITPMLLSVCVRDGRYRLAVEYARRYLTRRPGDGRLRFVLATIHLALGEAESAERELRTIAENGDTNPDLYYALGVLMRDHKSNQREACAHFREYLRLAPSGEHAEEARASMMVAGAP